MRQSKRWREFGKANTRASSGGYSERRYCSGSRGRAAGRRVFDLSTGSASTAGCSTAIVSAFAMQYIRF